MYKKFYRLAVDTVTMPVEGLILICEATTDGDGDYHYVQMIVGESNAYDIDTTGITDHDEIMELIRSRMVEYLKNPYIGGASGGQKEYVISGEDIIIVGSEIHIRGEFTSNLECVDDGDSFSWQFYNVEDSFTVEHEFVIQGDCSLAGNRATSDAFINRMIKPELSIEGTHTHNYNTPRTGGIVNFEYVSNGGLHYSFDKYIPVKNTSDLYVLTAEMRLDGNVEYKVIGGANELHNLYEFVTVHNGDTSTISYRPDTYHLITGKGVDDDVTVNIKDQFGCIVSLSTKTVTKERLPYAKISKSNSLRYIEKNVINECDYKTEESELICEWNNNTNEDYKQLFTKCDVIKTQVKTNYNGLLRARVFGGHEVSMLFSLIQENIGIQDRRTAKLRFVKKINVNGTSLYKYQLYFINGDLLNGATVLGSYDLGKYLPEYFKELNAIIIEVPGDEISLTIHDIVYNSDLGCFVLDMTTEEDWGNDVDVIATSDYDRKKYNVYDFIIPMEGMEVLENNISAIELRDSVFDIKEFTTEEFEITKNLNKLIKINYFNNSDTDTINEIHHVQNYRRTDKFPEEEINTKQNITDQSVQKYNVQIMELMQYNLQPIPFQMYRRLALALNYENVLINGVDSKFKTINKENRGRSNMTSVVFTVYKNKI